jgi:hypothetical protein
MFILPFIHKVVNQQSFDINIVKFLTIAGKGLWEEEKIVRVDKDILNPNDIYRKGKPIKLDKLLRLYEVDEIKTNISDFYMWDEIEKDDNETFCWRTYYIITGDKGISWLDIPDDEKLGNYKLKDLINAVVRPVRILNKH